MYLNSIAGALLAPILLIFSSCITYCGAASVDNSSSHNVSLSGGDDSLEFLIAVQQKNLPLLEQLVASISDPQSPNYGTYLTREEVGGLTQNLAAHDAIVQWFAGQAGVTSLRATRFREYITVAAPRSVWRGMLAEEAIDHILRSSSLPMSEPDTAALLLPTTLSSQQHISGIFHLSKKRLRHDLAGVVRPLGRTTGATVTPSVLNKVYDIRDNTGNSQASQGIYQTKGQTFSEGDLAEFQRSFGLPRDQVDRLVNLTPDDHLCAASADSCSEGNLDVQYMLAVSQLTPTTVHYDDTDNFVLGWIREVSDAPTHSLVYSISWAIQEQDIDAGYVAAFNTEALKLAAMGVTLVAASGDDGANYKGVCGYSPAFPASSRYVVAVGASQGPEEGGPEVVCQADSGKDVTSGGGFSTLDSAPDYQTQAIRDYFSGLPASEQPQPGYSATGRGYPDVSLLGYAYEVVVGGRVRLISGTSASAPVFAGMVSLANAARLERGKGSLGWLQPALYANAQAFARDITSGNNKCGRASDAGGDSSANCCSQGFYASTGWDPASGLGSVDFQKFLDFFVNL